MGVSNEYILFLSKEYMKPNISERKYAMEEIRNLHWKDVSEMCKSLEEVTDSIRYLMSFYICDRLKNNKSSDILRLVIELRDSDILKKLMPTITASLGNERMIYK